MLPQIIFLHRSPRMVVFLEDPETAGQSCWSPGGLGSAPVCLRSRAWSQKQLPRGPDQRGTSDSLLLVLFPFWHESIYPVLAPPWCFGSSRSAFPGWQEGIVLKWIILWVSFISALHKLFFLPLSHTSNELRPLVSPGCEIDTIWMEGMGVG